MPNGYSEYAIIRQNPQNEQQRTLDTLKVQTDYLVTEINGIKDVLGDFITEVRSHLQDLTEHVSTIKRVSEG